LKRYPNLIWWFTLKHKDRYNTWVIENGKKKRVSDNYFIINGKNKFKGWKCNLGLDHINIHQAGRISGNCGQFLYNKVGHYNFYDTNFVSNFSPIIQPVLCTQFSCNCGFETNVSKAIWIKQI
jgi:hypothetical protein